VLTTRVAEPIANGVITEKLAVAKPDRIDRHAAAPLLLPSP
jgi:hypothetical protein